MSRSFLSLALLLCIAGVAFAQDMTLNFDKATRENIQAALVDFDKEKYDAALEKVRVADAAHPNDPFILNLMGAAYVKKKQYDEGLKYFTRVLEAQPTFFPAMFNVAEVDFLQKRYPEALKKFNAMLETTPPGEPSRELLQFKVFLCFLMMDQKDDAQKMLGKIKNPGDTPAWYYAQAAWEMKQGNKKQALDYVRGGLFIFGQKVALFEDTLTDLGLQPK